jgi:anti-sigma-K factor RskA
MPDDAPESAADELTNLALLYSTGELDEIETADFERRLAEDQAARDALCQAVEMNLTLTGAASPAPDPAYRQRVRQRLHQRRRHLRKLESQSAFVGHPALWTALGAAAAGLLMVVVHHLTLTPPERANGTATVNPSEPSLAVQQEELKRRLDAVEKQANDVVLKLAGALAEADRRTQEEQLRLLAQQMVDIDAQLLKVQVRLLEKQLGETKRDLDDLLAAKDQRAQKRYENLLEQVKKLKS